MPKWLTLLFGGADADGQIVDIEINSIRVPEQSRPLNEDNVERLAQSISALGLLHPVYVTESEGTYVLLWGRHRFEACRRIDAETVRCIVLEGDPRVLELAEVDENLIRNELGPSEYSRLVCRREELLKHLAARQAELSQSETLSDRVQGSIRDHAERTGESKDSIHRALKRGKALGSDILKKTSGTCLDKDVELDALAKMTKEARDQLLARMEAGEPVSARTPDGKPRKRMTVDQLEPHAKALGSFHKWRECNPCVREMARLQKPIAEIEQVLSSEQTT